MILQELQRISDSVGEINGWDFSRLRVERDPMPWDYVEVARQYLTPTSRVLDVGTGGGEVFRQLVPDLGTGVAVDADPRMIETARANLPREMAGKVTFEVMRAQDLRFPAESLDVVLNRHAPVFVDQIVPLLRADGVFVHQLVAGRNSQNVFDAFGWGSNGAYWASYWQQHQLPAQDGASLAEAFRQAGCSVIARGEYDVRYYFLDVESFVFWLKAVPLPEDFDAAKHWRQVDRFLAQHTTPRGILTNEHRELVIVRKEGSVRMPPSRLAHGVANQESRL